MMKILLAHNFYQQPGGEDQVFFTESKLLSNHGHEVHHYTLHNERIQRMSKLSAAARSLWSGEAYSQIKTMLQAQQYHVAHFHNIFPLMSPASIYAAKNSGLPVIMTLHNYRLLCVNALLYRNGAVCEDCLTKRFKWPGVVRACYRGSAAASAAAALSLFVHGTLNTWSREVDCYIALTDFAREKFITAGLPENRVAVKPNFVYPDFGAGTHKGDFVLYVGRLTPEKGVNTLLEAWLTYRLNIPLLIIGDGPCRARVEAAAQQSKWITFLGAIPREEVIAHMQRAQLLLFPSEWYEGFPMTIAESFAAGLPVIASNLGSMASLIDHGRTGRLFQPKDPEDLANQVDDLMSHSHELVRMRRETREEYLKKYSAERNYQILMSIYQRAADGACQV